MLLSMHYLIIILMMTLMSLDWFVKWRFKLVFVDDKNIATIVCMINLYIFY